MQLIAHRLLMSASGLRIHSISNGNPVKYLMNTESRGRLKGEVWGDGTPSRKRKGLEERGRAPPRTMSGCICWVPTKLQLAAASHTHNPVRLLPCSRTQKSPQRNLAG